MALKIILISGKQCSGKKSLAKSLETQLKKYPNHIVKQFTFSRDIREAYEKPSDIDDNFWVDEVNKKMQITFERYFNSDADFEDDKKHLVCIISDCLYKNEFESFRGGTTVRLECRDDIRHKRGAKLGNYSYHPAEIELDEHSAKKDFDYIFRSDILDPDEIAEILIIKSIKP